MGKGRTNVRTWKPRGILEVSGDGTLEVSGDGPREVSGDGILDFELPE